MTRLVLDISRTLSRAAHPVPTGIDRVELAYAEWLLANRADALDFVAVHPLGRFAVLPRRPAERFIRATAARWRRPGIDAEDIKALGRRLYASVLLRSAMPRTPAKDSVYLLTSHHHLDKQALVGAMRARFGAMLCFIHDLIPMEFPEYARPHEPARHARRMRNAAALSDAVVVNSTDTATAFAKCLRDAGRNPPVLVAPLGVDRVARRMPASLPTAEPPLFLCIGTIEPRKNHLLLLHLWRRLAETHGAAAPHLLLVGRRGWENENIIDMLDRCTALHGLVTERNAVPDAELRTLLGRARALLLPSFAEGYGLPVAEALASSLPVLCSDLPALREVGGDAAEYLDPLNGPGWMQAVLDYAAPHSPRRTAQLARLAQWSPPGWDPHMRAVMDLVADIARPGQQGSGTPAV